MKLITEDKTDIEGIKPPINQEYVKVLSKATKQIYAMSIYMSLKDYCRQAYCWHKGLDQSALDDYADESTSFHRILANIRWHFRYYLKEDNAADFEIANKNAKSIFKNTGNVPSFLSSCVYYLIKYGNYINSRYIIDMLLHYDGEVLDALLDSKYTYRQFKFIVKALAVLDDVVDISAKDFSKDVYMLTLFMIKTLYKEYKENKRREEWYP